MAQSVLLKNLKADKLSCIFNDTGIVEEKLNEEKSISNRLFIHIFFIWNNPANGRGL